MALNKLAHLSLVNKVTTELENHIGIADKTLSEFVIDLAEKHNDARSFQKALDAVGAELSFDLVRNLLEMIQRMRPGGGGAGPSAGSGGASGSRAAPLRPTADNPFPGLSVRDDEARAKALTREIYGDNPITANMADDPKLASEASRRDGGRRTAGAIATATTGGGREERGAGRAAARIAVGGAAEVGVRPRAAAATRAGTARAAPGATTAAHRAPRRAPPRARRTRASRRWARFTAVA